MNSLMVDKIAFIGGGTMACAFVKGLLSQQLIAPERIVVGEPFEAQRERLVQEMGVGVTASNAEAVADAEIVVLAVKPQVIGRVFQSLAGQVAPGTMVLSIVAGTTIETIREALGIEAIVRVMPNTPAQIGEGISVWTATEAISDAQCECVVAMLGALGQDIRVEDEHYLDMATAMSGSGPAYVFLFIEALTDAGVHMGFSRPVAAQLALQTVKGAACYAQETGQHPALLRNQVTSPGGTTAAALHQFETGSFRAVVAQAVWAAYERARALGQK